MSRLQGHEFATDHELQITYDRSVEVVDIYGRPNPDESADSVIFTDEGLCGIAAEHLVALQLRGEFSVFRYYDDRALVYTWSGNESALFESQTIGLGPRASGAGWHQGRNIDRARQPEPEDLTPYDRLDQMITDGGMARLLGTERILRYEAVAITGIMTAILSADSSRVWAMTCNPGL